MSTAAPWRRVPLLAASAALFALLALATSSHAATTTLNVVNAPYNANSNCSADATAAIQSAINDAAKTTPAIVLMGGSCFLTSTTIRLPGGVILAGQGQTATTLKSTQASGPLLHLTGSAPGVQDFKLDGSSQNQDTHSEWGVWLDATTNAVVQRMELWQTKDNAVMIVGGSGNTVTNSLLHGMGWNEPMPGNVDNASGVWIQGGAQNTTISGNTMRDMNRQWIHCLSTPSVSSNNSSQWNGVVVTNNIFTNCGLHGYAGGGAVSLTFGSNATVSGNDISNSPDSQLETQFVSYETIHNNKFYNTDGQAPPGVEAAGGLSNFAFTTNSCNLQDRCLWMYGSSAGDNSIVTVNGNTVTNGNVGTGHALHITGAQTATIHGNTIQPGCINGFYLQGSGLDVQFNNASGCSGGVVWIQDGTGNTLKNNSIDNNPWPGGGVELGGTLDNITVTCNDLSSDGYTVWNFSSGTNQVLSPNSGVCSSTSATATATPTAAATATPTRAATATPKPKPTRNPHG